LDLENCIALKFAYSKFVFSNTTLFKIAKGMNTLDKSIPEKLNLEAFSIDIALLAEVLHLDALNNWIFWFSI
jgi:hypothetical protein